MTIAVDIKTGAVVGQVVWTGLKHGCVTCLTKNGYEVFPRDSVRLEEVR